MNTIPMVAKAGEAGLVMDAPDLTIPFLREDGHQVLPGQTVVVGVRPRDITLVNPSSTDAMTAHASVEVVELLGADALLALKVGDRELMAEVGGVALPEVGQSAKIAFNPKALHVFDETSERALC
ncbi:TOBE domain-containing protein [Pelagibius sp. Alg239-R121]|uniref:TOBE domain-containing protein n=1 Tax=Pelagibius sp. Alg239-R121 TaxID=2993448 RepID=UPI0024A79A13|nr:TOBE domain-containing protein [Pelagibius sp. Alg239-R121]